MAFNYLLAIIWFAVILREDVHSDYKKWLENKPVNHTKEWMIRGLLILPSILLITLPHFTILKFIVSTLLIGAVWWELFDGWYNKKRGFPWRFNGSDDEDDSILDNFLQKLSDKQEAILKWGLITVFLIIHILLK